MSIPNRSRQPAESLTTAARRHRLELEAKPRFPFAMPERRRLLFAVDLLLANVAVLIALRLWNIRAHRPFDAQFLLSQAFWFFFLSGLSLLAIAANDGYDSRTAGNAFTAGFTVLKSTAWVVLVYLVVYFFSEPDSLPRVVVLFYTAVYFTLLLSWRSLYASTLTRMPFKRRAIIVGAGWAGRTIAETLRESPHMGYQLMGFIDDDPDKQGETIQGIPVLGTRQQLGSYVESSGASEIILAITHEIPDELFKALMGCLERGVQIIPMPLLYEELTGRVPVQHIGDNWYVAMPLNHQGTGVLYPALKRVMDILLASLGLFLLGLALPFIALALYLDSPGPIFYAQKRAGKMGKIFRAYKFRSMIPEAEKEGKAVWAEKRDPRVTRVGRLLRATHVDEFPQFLNVLKGEMTTVGPRAERPELVAELETEIPFYRMRYSIKPGMAGWALVRQGYGASKEDAAIKLEYDLYYIKHQSLWLDLIILLKTIVDTLTFRGR